MIDTLLNLFHGCFHRRITRPITPVHKAGSEAGTTYVVCLDCGQQFQYDTAQMRMGARLPKAKALAAGSYFQSSY